MTRYLILLELVNSLLTDGVNKGVCYSIGGIWKELSSVRFGAEWELDETTFNAEIIAMLEEGLLLVERPGIITLGDNGKVILRDSKFLAFIHDRLGDFKQVDRKSD